MKLLPQSLKRRRSLRRKKKIQRRRSPRMRSISYNERRKPVGRKLKRLPAPPSYG